MQPRPPVGAAPAPPEAIVGYLNDGILEFGPDAEGNVKPIRIFRHFGLAFAYGEDEAGNFWSFQNRYDVTGHLLGSVDIFRARGFEAQGFTADASQHLWLARWPLATSNGSDKHVEIDEFPANAYGRVRPLRRILLGPGSNLVHQMAVDGFGNVYATQDAAGSLNRQIVEYGPAGSGRERPVRVLGVPPGYAFYSDVKADAAGNLYALLQGARKPSLVVQYGPRGTSYSVLFKLRYVFPFTVNQAGDLFVVEQFARAASGRCLEQIVELEHGTGKRLLKIRGSRTVICRHRAGSITVPPS